jgi:hypothetical protein
MCVIARARLSKICACLCTRECKASLLTVVLTADKATALSYAFESKVSGIIFRYTTTGHTRGISIRHLSLYPREQEYLYPPLTNLKFDESQVSVFAPALLILLTELRHAISLTKPV